ncbi:MAG: hypothetical protein DRR42_24955 [Gammaproteobacteria bacterium]|nr:MAG: hypothetical protein DRR42_24955 [Gammaproteobacteria bacterium]
MPNGGVHHCGGCNHFIYEESFCSLRNVNIESSHWTTCRNINKNAGEIDGPIYAIVCEVKSGAGGYGDIPYIDDCRVDTIQEGSGDTIVRFTDRSGEAHEFNTVADYLAFYRESGREL